ncbi:GIY-YIG nuclease family protein [Rhodococcus pyridinivorans]|uniref:GIY-YIG nuclease family protein n=1 Tax=Rhodococcus pyridinivorans TaxID=103816 RepID=UPI0036BF311D
MAKIAGPNGGGAYHGDFRLSITKALGDQLALSLAQLGRAPLEKQYILELEERPGVYQLYLRGEFVYVGKADRSLRGRLLNHLRKLSGRQKVTLAEISFSCLYVDEDFSALAPEQLLISQHKEMGNIPWNSNGFGNKDPGRQRDRTILKKNHFDVLFPINLDRPVGGFDVGPMPLGEFLKDLKSALPYNFRYEEPPNSAITQIDVPHTCLSASEALRIVSAVLPDSWQITALMGYVIMYQDAPSEYKSAWRYYRGGEIIDVEPEAAPIDMKSDEGAFLMTDE